MKLSNFSQSRDNNFNLIRITAALAVLITHSFVLATGSINAEPLREYLGMSIGDIAVNIFFITSGFLVTASLLTRQSVIEFVWARVLRIFPALVIMLLLTVFGMGIFFTSLPVSDYLANSEVYIYFVKCASLITEVPYNLPGVFVHNPLRYMVNGSIWTMPYEIKMYAILVAVWGGLLLINRERIKLFKRVIITGVIVSGAIVFMGKFYYATIENLVLKFSIDGEFITLFFMFFSGATFYFLKEYIRLSHSLFWLCMIALVVATAINKDVFFVTYMLTIAYILFYIAYVPSGYIRKYNQVGDYSYGVYIYAFPIQQSLAALVPGISVLHMLLISAAVTLIFATLSWHLIERRALNLKSLYVDHTKNTLTSNPNVSSTRVADVTPSQRK